MIGSARNRCSTSDATERSLNASGADTASSAMAAWARTASRAVRRAPTYAATRKTTLTTSIALKLAIRPSAISF